MKITLALLMNMLLVLFPSCALDKEVPEEVKDAFNSKFPGATDISWELESSDEWEVEFSVDDLSQSALFQDNGKWLSTEYDFPVVDLPKNVIKALEYLLDQYHIEEVDFVETEIGQYYEVELERLGKELEIKVDTTGKVLERSTGSDD